MCNGNALNHIVVLKKKVKATYSGFKWHLVTKSTQTNKEECTGIK